MIETSHQFPPELNQPAPRKVKRTSKAGCWALPGWLILVIASLISGFFFYKIIVAILLLAFGQHYRGTVTGEHVVPGKHGASRYMRYSYTAGGKTLERERSLSDGCYGDFATTPSDGRSDEVEVRVLHLPGIYFDEAVRPGETLLLPMALRLLASVVFGLPNALPFYFMIIVPRRLRHLYRTGTPVIGKIVKKDVDAEKLDYTFYHPALGMRTVTMNASPDQMKQTQEEQLVTVLCYPGREKPTGIYELGDFQCV